MTSLMKCLNWTKISEKNSYQEKSKNKKIWTNENPEKIEERCQYQIAQTGDLTICSKISGIALLNDAGCVIFPSFSTNSRVP